MISWLGYGYSIDTATVQHVVSGFNPAWWNLETYSSNQRRNAYRLHSDYHDAADILIAAITEAQSGMPPGLNIYRDEVWKWAPAGVAECAKWWSGDSRYYQRRTPARAGPFELRRRRWSKGLATGAGGTAPRPPPSRSPRDS